MSTTTAITEAASENHPRRGRPPLWGDKYLDFIQQGIHNGMSRRQKLNRAYAFKAMGADEASATPGRQMFP